MIIMPGGGIDETNIAIIASSTKTEFHLTGRNHRQSNDIQKRECSWATQNIMNIPEGCDVQE